MLWSSFSYFFHISVHEETWLNISRMVHHHGSPKLGILDIFEIEIDIDCLSIGSELN